jgi:hypothetical protein
MHNVMIRRLNALDVLFKGGQKAVDEFMSSTLTGMEKLKSAALQKSKRASDSSGMSKKRSRQGGGGSSGAPSGGLSGGGQYQGGGNQGASNPETGHAMLEYNVANVESLATKPRIAEVCKVCWSVRKGSACQDKESIVLLAYSITTELVGRISRLFLVITHRKKPIKRFCTQLISLSLPDSSSR